MSEQLGEIRSTHSHAFRSGEWGRVLARFEEATTGRVCMLVQFEDGATDTWPVEDASDEREYR